MKKKLTIYIPSYNRASSLLRQLHAISSNIDTSKVFIIVNDNCSTDVGYADVENYCLKNDYIYNKNKFNDGGDANIFNGFMEFYRSEYIWILSDDDILADDTVSKVTTILENNMLDILFFTNSRIEVLETKKWTQRDFYEQNIKTADGAGLISNVIYRSEFIKESIPLGFQNIYTCWAHLSVLISSFKNKVAMIGNIGSCINFIPETNLPPSDSTGYSKSYFGFVLLGELFEDAIKKDFINAWASFWSLRHWHTKKKDQIAKQNCMYSENYIKHNLYLFNFFRLKLLFWFLMLPILNILKNNLSREKKDKILKFLKISF